MYDQETTPVDISVFWAFDMSRLVCLDIVYPIDMRAMKKRLHTSALASFNDQRSREISRDLNAIKGETQRRNLEIRDGIKALELSNAQLGKTSDAQMRRSQVE
ncbi:hypothetical protein BX666DRAFT_1874752 [Dichotomocladium elegans]|nr:hypothetical protein BX666DRAFT_1874752 [Dichotomocladium elegans]